MHSVRFSIQAERKADFMEDFFAFCGDLETRGRRATLRPHPGGQYVLKNDIALPPNVGIENEPMYRVDLTRFDYGISAPSTVLLDMMLAGIPVAVWRDPEGALDTSHYPGLRTISGREDWLAFEEAATANPAAIRQVQEEFLNGLAMPLDPNDIRARFSRLLAGAQAPIAVRTPVTTRRRILFIVNGIIPSFAISFLRPVKALQDNGQVEFAVLTEETLLTGFAEPWAAPAGEWVRESIRGYAPDLIVMCRYSGPQSQVIFDTAREIGTKTVYHFDDDLLNIPIEIGERKFRSHNTPVRLDSVRTCLSNADLLYCSTTPLMERTIEMGYDQAIIAGSIYCSAEVRREPLLRPHGKIGYMGFDHAHDLETILPALVTFLRRNPTIGFEMFGSIPKPQALEEFGDRISLVPPIADYEKFMRHFSSLGWDVGICPLADSPFNRVKADTKWVEYSAVGIAVVATGGMMYDRCSAGGCGLLANDEESWIAALETLCHDHDFRHRQVRNAQDKLRRFYSLDRLRLQMAEIFSQAFGAPFVTDKVVTESDDFIHEDLFVRPGTARALTHEAA